MKRFKNILVIYNEAIGADDALSQAAALARLRRQAAVTMQWLNPFKPRLTGAVLDGTADEHSRIRLLLVRLRRKLRDLNAEWSQSRCCVPGGSECYVFLFCLFFNRLLYLSDLRFGAERRFFWLCLVGLVALYRRCF